MYRSISDHCPILLKIEEISLGPKPFRTFDSWLNSEDFQKVVLLSWNSNSFVGIADFVLKEKIKALKKDMKAWASLENEKNSKRRNEINSALLDWDLKAELGDITEVDRLKRDVLLFDSFQLEHLERMDLKQKSRVK